MEDKVYKRGGKKPCGSSPTRTRNTTVELGGKFIPDQVVKQRLKRVLQLQYGFSPIAIL